MRWWIGMVCVLLAFPAQAAASMHGPMKVHYYQRPGSACASTDPTALGNKKFTSVGVSQTGITFDGRQLLVSCWADATILRISEGGDVIDQLQTGGVSGLGAIAWDPVDRVLWGCSIAATSPARSAQIGWMSYDPAGGAIGTWNFTGPAPHGCVNNLQYVDGRLWADGTYKDSGATSNWIDVGTASLLPTMSLTGVFHPFTPSHHVSGALPDANGQPQWEADNSGTTKSIWEAGASAPIETATLRFEQLACDPDSPGGPRLFVKWFNQNAFGTIPVDHCQA
jgi:hypothetical protein